MEINRGIPKRIFTFAMVVCGIIIAIASFEALGNITNTDSFNRLKETLSDENKPYAFEHFKENIIMLYFIRVVPFIGFGINIGLAYYKVGFTRAFLVIWSMVLLGTLVLHVLTMDYRSIYFYIYILGHILLIGSLFSLSSHLERKNKREV